MNKIVVYRKSLGDDLSFSAEHWLSKANAESFRTGVPVTTLIRIAGDGTNRFVDDALMLDTGAANNGFLQINAHNPAKRTSHKKLVEEGDVLISRLRPYLRQVCYIPIGVKSLLDIDAIYCSTEFYVLRSLDPAKSVAFLVPWLLSDRVQKILLDATTGGHHPRFNSGLLEDLHVPQSFCRDAVALSERVSEICLRYLRAQYELTRLVQSSSSTTV